MAWLHITGSDQIPGGRPPPGQPQHEPGQPQNQGQDIQEIHPHAQ